jgi:CheY-like chemotaxis protein
VTQELITVLVVDDREANRYTTVHALTRSGFQVVEASSGKEALELSRSLPSVIVLDVRLPDILGYDVCRRIKANTQTRHIPVLQLSSAFLSNESKLFALESGADAYLIQPADPVVLVATVKSLVRLHAAESQAQLAARQWQTTFDALSEGVAMIDRTGLILRCNRAMTSLLGRSYGEIENRDLRELLPSVSPPRPRICQSSLRLKSKQGAVSSASALIPSPAIANRRPAASLSSARRPSKNSPKKHCSSASAWPPPAASHTPSRMRSTTRWKH